MVDYPCTNPACKSFGKPHPNCKCEPHLAHGGEVDAPENHHHAIAGYLAKHGIHGLISSYHFNNYQKYRDAKIKGHKDLDDHVELVFSGQDLPFVDSTKSKEAIKDWITKGGVDNDIQEEIYLGHQSPERLAEGGQVKAKSLHNEMLSQEHPEQNMMLQMAKGRISNYLNSQKPQELTPKLAFDSDPDQTDAKRSYDKALNIAAHPLSVLEKIKKGTIEPEDIKHFTSMYPELNDSLQNKLTKKIIKSQLAGSKPSYRIRTGLSLLMGTPLSSDFTPQNIQAAQNVFQGQQPSNQAPIKNKKGTSSLTKSDDSFLTKSQSLVGRQQRQ